MVSYCIFQIAVFDPFPQPSNDFDLSANGFCNVQRV